MKTPLSKLGYLLNSQTNVWLRPDFLGIVYSDGNEVEQRIAAIIKNATDLSTLSDELRPHCTDWPSLYHLSATRANILRPFEQDLKGDVLEIGAGCGAITRYLGECGGQILALEGTPRRASIARARTRDLDNVTVVSDRFSDFNYNKKFDVVTLIGVLEYANLFTDGENPAALMLERVRSFLKPNGKLFIAIENQLGLKYFAGAPEDHVGISMYGIEGRYKKDQPQTYGRKHLHQLIEGVGFSSVKFLSPFPDYKLPVSVVTESGFSSDDFDAATLACQSVKKDPQLPKITAFSPQLAWPSIVDNGLSIDLSNSFLIVAAPQANEELISPSVLGWHFSTERRKVLCKLTKFVRNSAGQIDVIYKKLDEKSPNPLLGQLLNNHLAENDHYKFGTVLSDDLMNIISRDGWHVQEISYFISIWLNHLSQLSRIKSQIINLPKQSTLLPGKFFDFIPQNLVRVNDGSLHAIDKEWTFNKKIETEFIVFRLLWAAIHSVSKFGKPENFEIKTYYDFIVHCMMAMGWKISNKNIEQCVELECQVQSEVAGRPIDSSGVMNWLQCNLIPVENLNQAVVERDGQITSLSQAVVERDGQITSLSQAVVERDGQITSLSQAVVERDGQIADLNQVVVERDGQITSLNQVVVERDGQITSLNQAVVERDGQIADLNQVVVERDGQITSLSQAVVERDGQITSLNQAVVERDGQITSLSQAVVERDGQIADLNQVVVERDGQITSLNQAVVERDGQITSLNQAVVERDGQIADLNQVVVERDGQIARLNQALSELDGKINAMEQSYSWRITRPLAKSFGRSSKIGIIFRRAVKLMWWAATFQLHKKIKSWRASRQANCDKQPHFSPPNGDYFFVVPFGYSEAQKIYAPSVAVICHMFYPDLLGEFKSYLKNIPFKFDLFITTDSVEKRDAIAKGLAEWQHGKFEIRIVENRGRDIAPKLISCGDIYERYEFFLYIHSKKSPHWDALTNWRSYLLSNLVGSKDIVKSIFDAFDSDPKLGIISPEHYATVRGSIGWGWNFDNAKKFAKRLGLDLDRNTKVDFPSGSMFWGRSAAIAPLLNAGLTTKDFPDERGQIDGTLGHVIERLYFFVCEKSGYRWIKIGIPELVSGTDRGLYIDEPGSLRFLIGLSQYDLLHSLDSSLYSSLKISSNAMESLSADVGLSSETSSKFNMHDMPFKKYLKNYRDCFSEEWEPHDFDESFYLSAHPDVAAAVSRGDVLSGYDHFRSVGRVEGRVYSDGQIQRQFDLEANWPAGIFAPVDRLPLRKSTDLSSLPQSKKPLMLVMLSHLQSDLFFAGYSEFFKDYRSVFSLFDRVVITVENHEYDKSIAESYLSSVEFIKNDDILSIGCKPDLVVCFNAHLTCLAHQMLPKDLGRIVYYCQDFESGFFPYGADYIVGEQAVACSKNLVISTVLLRKFFERNKLIDSQNIFVTRPKIEVLNVSPEKRKKIFFYYRPEYFHKRNLPETLMEAMRQFCHRHTGYEIYMVGSVATAYSFKQNGNQVYVINKLPKDRYVELISSCDVVVSMIYAAHPGIVAYQAAASGIPTVTNIFYNRDSFDLERISCNIVSYDPVRERLIDVIEKALKMPKGIRSFNQEFYSGREEGSLVEFHKTILTSTSV